MNILKTVIVDDEKNNIEALQYMLADSCPNVKIVETFRHTDEALYYLNSKPVDLLFLDVQMPGLNGFELLERLDEIRFKLIFVTAYDQYAIKAIKFNALDYLLKPVNCIELTQAVERAEQPRHMQLSQIKKLKNDKNLDKIALTTGTGLQFIKLSSIMYLEGNGSYTTVVDEGGSKYLVSKNIAAFEELLCDAESHFFRPHKSFLINLSFIKEYIRGDGGEIVMIDKKVIVLSRTKKQEFFDLFSKI